MTAQLHILIVEEDTRAQLILSRYLKDLDYNHITIADNGDEALKKIASEEIDMIFLNIRIKGTKSGIEIGKIISQQFVHIPFFYLTMEIDQQTLEEALYTHPFSIIHEPYDKEELKQTIASAINHLQIAKVNSRLNSSHALNMIFETTHTGICIIDIQGKFVKVNQAYCEIFGYTRQELIGKDFTIIFPERTKKYAANLHLEYIKGLTEESNGEWKVIDKRGNEKEVYLAVGRMVTETGESYKVTTVTDITEKKREGEKLKKMLQEKDMFVRKLHHLVKNNLNIISGLLLLQSEKLRAKPDVYGLYQESLNRIKPIIMIHEQLHSYESFSDIDLREYVTALNSSLQSTYGTSAKNITVHLHIDDIKLDVDKAITCGLIINEMLSNSYKHAFEPDQPGEIKLSITIEGYQVIIKISDNGRGLPSSFILENAHTLGMQLIKTLSAQLNSRLYINREQGTEITLSFNI